MYRTPEMSCSVRGALLLLSLLEWADTRTGRAIHLSWLVPGMHFVFVCISLLDEGFSRSTVRFSYYGT
jgi:hypothetical protein